MKEIKLTMYLLTGGAMAVLRVQRLLPTQLILDLPAMTATFIANVKIWIVVVDFIRCSMLPLIELSLCTAIIPIVAIRPVCRCCHGLDVYL